SGGLDRPQPDRGDSTSLSGRATGWIRRREQHPPTRGGAMSLWTASGQPGVEFPELELSVMRAASRTTCFRQRGSSDPWPRESVARGAPYLFVAFDTRRMQVHGRAGGRRLTGTNAEPEGGARRRALGREESSWQGEALAERLVVAARLAGGLARPPKYRGVAWWRGAKG